MSWLGDFLRSLTGTDTTGLEAATLRSQRQTNLAFDEAFNAERLAADRLTRAAVPPGDREDTRLAAEEELRRILEAGGARFEGQPMGAAAVGRRTFGSY